LLSKLILTVLVILSLFMVSMPGCAGSEKTATTTNAATSAALTISTQAATSTSTKTGSGAGTGTATAASNTAASYGIKVTQNGKTLLNLSLADIDKLTTVTISADGSSYTGPTILSILSKAGITDFTKVNIVGFAKGRLATAELPVTKAELNDKYIVRRTNQNTYSLASPDVPSNNWIIDVNELRVE